MISLTGSPTRYVSNTIGLSTRLHDCVWPVEINLLGVGTDLGLYEHFAQLNGSTSSGDIAGAPGAELVLMRCILRCIAAARHVDELDTDRFAANKFTHP